MPSNVARISRKHGALSAGTAFLHIIDTSRLLKLLRDDDRAILTAAAKAEEASSLLLTLGGRAIADVAE